MKRLRFCKSQNTKTKYTVRYINLITKWFFVVDSKNSENSSESVCVQNDRQHKSTSTITFKHKLQRKI